MSQITPDTINLWGETLCLNLANTVDWTDGDEHVDPDLTDVLRTTDLARRWGVRLGLLEERTGLTISSDELHRLRRLRDAVYATFSAIARDRAPAREHLNVLWSQHQEAIKNAELNDATPFAPSWALDDPRRLRFAAAGDAIALLTDPSRLARVSRCPGRDCGWLFLNLSGRRRWCSMSACGSREKMRRAYRRTHHPGANADRPHPNI
jgi:predicted RNA-binding Zn ribbon-like protein